MAIAQRSIGQEQFGFAGRVRPSSSLDELGALIVRNSVAALLALHKLDPALFEAVTMQLKSRAVTVKTGTLVDATIIASASEDDDEARWVKHKGKRAVPGFKAHVGADADTALVEEVSITSANTNDGKAGPEALPDNPGEVFAGSA